MKKILLALCLFAAPLLAQPPAPPATPADADFTAFEALRQATPPAPPKEIGLAKYYAWVDDSRKQTQAAGLAFYEKYPSDARRWDVVTTITGAAPLYVKQFGPDAETKGLAGATFDEAAKAAWQKKSDELKQALMASSDATPKQKEGVEWSFFARDFRATSAAKQAGKPYDYSVFRPRFEAHVAKYPDLPVLAARARDYLGALESYEPGTSMAEWRRYADSPNPDLREAAATKIAALEKMAKLTEKPLEMTFTAADGRAVDLKNLRGKVVLVDFWATWCGPCKEEIPNVKKVYAAYHDKGFEVVGISLENGRLIPQDTPEQIAGKLETAKKILTDFTAENAMPWPQYFDGKFWKNDISTQYDINAIPAMFLLDQDGKVVSTSARGPTLEKEVKRLLKL